MDPRFKKIASAVMRHSLKIQPGEKVMISAVDDGDKLVEALVEEAYVCGAVPFVSLEQATIRHAILKGATVGQLGLMAKPSVILMGEMDCHVTISAPYNSYEFCLISQERQTIYTEYCKSLISRAKSKLRQVSLIYPSHGMIQNAGMSLSEFSDYYSGLMTMDYDGLEKTPLPITLRMRAADQVRIVAPSTNLTVSLKGFTALIAAGEHNLPNGEIASTPNRCSVNGAISFNTPSMHDGLLLTDARLTFKDGKVVEASANDIERLLKRISLDEGCHYIDEFSMEADPYVQCVVYETPSDEEMGGSMHMALGTCCNSPGRDNDNQSSIHWDLIQNHRLEHGGDEVWIDDELVRKDSIYLPGGLHVLNPDVYFAQDW